MALIASKNNEIMGYKDYKKLLEKREPKEEPEETSAKATGNAGAQGQTGARTGQQRPDTTSSMVSDMDETHNRLGSAEVRNRPGSASITSRPHEAHQNVASKEQIIEEDPEENCDDRFMIKMFSEGDMLPFNMNILYISDDDATQIINRDDHNADTGKCEFTDSKEVIVFDDARQREGYYRMVITRRQEVAQFNPVSIMINCNGVTHARKFDRDPFSRSAKAEEFLDYAVFKFPDNEFMVLNIMTQENISTPTFMLPNIRSLINKLSESKLKIEKMFGFGGKGVTKIEGEECLSVEEVKKSLSEFEIPISDHVLQAFKPIHSDKWVSLKLLTDTVESWKRCISVLDEINDEEEEEDYDGMNDYDDEYQDHDQDN